MSPDALINWNPDPLPRDGVWKCGEFLAIWSILWAPWVWGFHVILVQVSPKRSVQGGEGGDSLHFWPLQGKSPLGVGVAVSIEKCITAKQRLQ